MTENSRKLNASMQMPANENPQTTLAAAERCSFLVDSAVDAVGSATKMRLLAWPTRSAAVVNISPCREAPQQRRGQDSVDALIAFDLAASGATLTDLGLTKAQPV